MSAEATRQQPAGDDTEGRATVEERVERIATYWGRAVVDAWRTVFPRREDTR
jgi:hypothetical protein